MASWDLPPGSTRFGTIPLQSVQFLPGAAAPFTEPPPCFPSGLGLYSLRGTSWLPLFEDCESKVLMLHTKTGCVRSAPWISLRTAYGCVFFVNLITHQTRWLPPLRWMQDWVSRPSINEDGRAYRMALEGTRFTRDLLPPLDRLRLGCVSRGAHLTFGNLESQLTLATIMTPDSHIQSLARDTANPSLGRVS
jgi:hypothetical protein